MHREMGPASLPTPLSPMRGQAPQGCRNLASDVSASIHPRMGASFVTGARTGIRIHPPSGRSGRVRSEDRRLPLRPTFDGRLRGPAFHCWPAPRTVASHVRPESLDATPPSASGRAGPTRGEAHSRFRHRLALRRTKSFARIVSRSAWTGSDTSFKDAVSVVLQVVRPVQTGRFASPSDGLKLRLDARLRKRHRADLSTSAQIACGRRWTSQPLVANLPVASPVSLSQQPQAQGVELDEALSVLLIVGSGIVLERDMCLGIERIG